jgi:HEAT repeats
VVINSRCSHRGQATAAASRAGALAIPYLNVVVRCAVGLGLLALVATLAWTLTRGPTLEPETVAESADSTQPTPGALSDPDQPTLSPLAQGSSTKPETTTPCTLPENRSYFRDLTIPPPVVGEVIVKRRSKYTDEDLVRHVKDASKVELGTTGVQAITASKAGQTDDLTLAFLDSRADLAGLPLRRGTVCKLTYFDAAHLNKYSAVLRGKTDDVAQLAPILAHDVRQPGFWLRGETVPALMQMLMAGPDSVRELLLNQLARIQGKEASAALAQLALFDLRLSIREGAIRALGKRQAEEYQSALLKGFEHPWPAVADHAAEALVALRLREAVPDLVRLLNAPDPRAIYSKPDSKGPFLKEMVRINHRQNCLLCHPPSFNSSDVPRGAVPSPSESAAYYERGNGIFVRADITYLKQDFSVGLPKSKSAGSELERFDYVIRERVALPNDVIQRRTSIETAPCEQREAVLFALRELTGQQLTVAANWEAYLRWQVTSPALVHTQR